MALFNRRKKKEKQKVPKISDLCDILKATRKPKEGSFL